MSRGLSLFSCCLLTLFAIGCADGSTSDMTDADSGDAITTPPGGSSPPPAATNDSASDAADDGVTAAGMSGMDDGEDEDHMDDGEEMAMSMDDGAAGESGGDGDGDGDDLGPPPACLFSPGCDTIPAPTNELCPAGMVFCYREEGTCCIPAPQAGTCGC